MRTNPVRSIPAGSELIDVASRHDRAQHAHYAHPPTLHAAGNAHAEHAHGSSHGHLMRRMVPARSH